MIDRKIVELALAGMRRSTRRHWKTELAYVAGALSEVDGDDYDKFMSALEIAARDPSLRHAIDLRAAEIVRNVLQDARDRELCAACNHRRGSHLDESDRGWCTRPTGSCIFNPCSCLRFVEPSGDQS